jgi:hypothetical protein
MLEVLKGFGFLRIVGLFLLGMIPSYVFLTLRFSYTLPTQPCGTKGHQLLLMASSGSGLTTTVRFSLSETNLKALYIPYGTHMDETPWEAMGQFLSISRPVWGEAFSVSPTPSCDAPLVSNNAMYRFVFQACLRNADSLAGFVATK